MEWFQFEEIIYFESFLSLAGSELNPKLTLQLGEINAAIPPFRLLLGFSSPTAGCIPSIPGISGISVLVSFLPLHFQHVFTGKCL